MRVVGFEGSDRGAPIAFGAAAIKDGKSILNAVTRRRTSLKEWEEICKEGHATEVTPHTLRFTQYSMTVRQTVEATRCFLMQLHPAFYRSAPLKLLRDRALESWSCSDTNFHYVLFHNLRALLHACRAVIPALREEGVILYGEVANILQAIVDADPLENDGDEEKLIRSRVPERIRADGCVARTREANPKEMWGLLLAKLEEEFNELREAKPEDRPTELADVMEVVRALGRHIGPKKVDMASRKKARSHGRLSKTVLLGWDKLA